MLRRFLLVGVAVVISPGSLTQLAVGTVVSLAHMMVQIQARPHRHTSDVFVALSASLSLVVLFVCCTNLKAGTLAELDAVISSPALKATFTVPETLISIALLLAIAGSLAFSAFLLVYQLRDERRAEAERKRLEMHEAAARRLCSVDGTPVEIAPPSRDYHVFLSHVWGSGQDQMRIVKQRLREMLPAIKVFLAPGDDLQPSFSSVLLLTPFICPGSGLPRRGRP